MAKTTIADAELVLDQGPYRAVVTFLPRDLVRDYVEECLSEAVLSAYRRQADTEVLRRVLPGRKSLHTVGSIFAN